jgi:hypothetical protein
MMIVRTTVILMIPFLVRYHGTRLSTASYSFAAVESSLRPQLLLPGLELRATPLCSFGAPLAGEESAREPWLSSGRPTLFPP